MYTIRHSVKVTALTFFVVCVICSTFSLRPIRAHAAGAPAALDFSDILNVPVKSFTQAAEKLAHTGISFYGIPVPFTSWDSTVKLIVKQFIGQLRRQVLMWIVTGGKNGNPLVETNLGNFLSMVGDTTGSKYVSGLGGSNSRVCNSFKSGIVSALATQFKLSGDDGEGGGGVFNIDIGGFLGGGGGRTDDGGCEIENRVGQDNLQRYAEGDFVGGGGWDTWSMLTTNDYNNPVGTYLSEKDNTAVTIAREKDLEQKKLDWGKGVHAVEDSKGNVKTPAAAIVDQLDFVLTSDLRQFELAKTFDDIVTTLANTMISQAINNVQGLINKTFVDGLNAVANAGGKGGPGSNSEYERPVFPTQGITSLSARRDESSISSSGTATQSTTPNNFASGRHDASVALTGAYNRNPDYGVSITGDQNNAWWQVDFGAPPRPIKKIVITPPALEDYRLTNYYVYVSNSPISSNATPSNAEIVPGNEEQGIWRSELIVNDDMNRVITIKPQAIGRYVRIQKTDHGRLMIAGVDIYADVVPVIYLSGGDDIKVPIDTTQDARFVDPGYSAVDEEGTDFTKDVVVTGKVNIKVKGDYTLTYTVRSVAGVKVTLKRHVEVVE